jgi:hypothetical protein
MIEKIIRDGHELALILRSEFNQDGIKFLTPQDYSQQLGYMKRPPGYIIEPHIHNLYPRSVSYTNEVLFIRSGLVRVDFYDQKKCYFSSALLKSGDVILLISGGHGFEILEESVIIEVKQGPYAGELDKSRFNAENHQIVYWPKNEK